MTALLVALGAAVGAPLRYLTDRFVQSRHDTVFPWGTFCVNAVGSLVLGVTLGAASRRHVSPHLVALVGTGFCGALTTYSTFGYEVVRLAGKRARHLAAATAAGSVSVGLLVAAVGWALGSHL